MLRLSGKRWLSQHPLSSIRMTRSLHSSPSFFARPPAGDLNRMSRTITRPKDQGASQAMLYATEGIESDEDLQRAMVGVASIWYEGNPCNAHLLDLGKRVKKSLHDAGLTGYQFGAVGVSDGISMGTDAMSYSLPSRDLIADSVESAAGGHWLDGMVTIAGCDKNMPGVLMGLGRLNRPGLMVYGGTIRPGQCESVAGPLDIVSAFQSYGQYLSEGGTPDAERKRYNTIRNCCPGVGACGGMYTANTMATCAETIGMTLPGSSSFPAEYGEKGAECDSVGAAMRVLLEKHIRPRDIMTREAFLEAITVTMILGGSTNAVLHLIAMARSVEVDITLDDFQTISDKTPFIADLKPSGKYVMEDVHKQLGGIPTVLQYLIEKKVITGDHLTVTGKTLAENCDRWTHERGKLPAGQDVLKPLEKPIKATGHIRILRGNLAPGGSVAKITGKEGLQFKGKARVFDTEDQLVAAVENKEIKKGEKTVMVLRQKGPKGGIGMPEMLKPTSLIMGAGLGMDVACVTDGRFSGGSHGFVIGHVTPEAQVGGPIGLVQDGDIINIDAELNTIDIVDITEAELERRRANWKPLPLKAKAGHLFKYAKNVSDASHGCVTDL